MALWKYCGHLVLCNRHAAVAVEAAAVPLLLLCMQPYHIIAIDRASCELVADLALCVYIYQMTVCTASNTMDCSD
eukprot:5730-Heterococcus_DN1.PRE.2